MLANTQVFQKKVFAMNVFMTLGLRRGGKTHHKSQNFDTFVKYSLQGLMMYPRLKSL